MEWVMGLFVLVVVFIVGMKFASKSSPAVEPKRFGLEQAEAALVYVGDAGPAATKAVLGVVVGVLGFENTVVADAEAEVFEIEGDNSRFSAKVGFHQNEIAVLQARIAALQAAMVDGDARAEVVRKIAVAFTA